MRRLGNYLPVTLPSNRQNRVAASNIIIFFAFNVQSSHIIIMWEDCKNPLFKPFFPIVPYYHVPLGKMVIMRQRPILPHSLRVRGNMGRLRETHCLSHFYNLPSLFFRGKIGELSSCNVAPKQTKPCCNVQYSHIITMWEYCKNPLFKPFFPIFPYYHVPLGKMVIMR